MRRILVGVMLMAPIAGACRDDKTWVEVCRSAQLMPEDRVTKLQSQLTSLESTQLELVSKLLNQVGAHPTSASGIQAAHKGLKDGIQQLVDPASDDSSGGVQANAARNAGSCVLQGLVRRTGEATAKGEAPATHAEAVLQAVEGITFLGPGFTGTLKEELRLGLGPELYIATLRARQPAP